jgi:hypothetical protein
VGVWGRALQAGVELGQGIRDYLILFLAPNLLTNLKGRDALELGTAGDLKQLLMADCEEG